MKKSLSFIIAIIIITGCANISGTTFLKVNNKRIQTFGFDNPGNLYVIKYKNITNKAILNNLLKKYKSNEPMLLKHISGVSINIDNDDLKKVIEDFLQAGEIEYIERTPAKTLY